MLQPEILYTTGLQPRRQGRSDSSASLALKRWQALWIEGSQRHVRWGEVKFTEKVSMNIARP